MGRKPKFPRTPQLLDQADCGGANQTQIQWLTDSYANEDSRPMLLHQMAEELLGDVGKIREVERLGFCWWDCVLLALRREISPPVARVVSMCTCEADGSAGRMWACRFRTAFNWRNRGISAPSAILPCGHPMLVQHRQHIKAGQLLLLHKLGLATVLRTLS